MKLKFIILTFIGLLSYQLSWAQTQKEFYFCFPLHQRGKISSITKKISIDNVRNDTVWAYANIEQFLKFSKEGYDITLLPSPGYAPEMAKGDKGTLSPLTSWNAYPTYSQYESLMTAFQTNYPAICKLSTIGTLASGRKLIVAKISDNVATDETEPEFLYTSSMHGDETTGFILMMRLIEYLLVNYGTNAEVTDLVNGMEIFINPLANPDGTYAGGIYPYSGTGATRGNANGVDLNRNYPDIVDLVNPNEQPETIAFKAFATERHFVAAANFHGGVEVVNYPWDTWVTLSADDNWWQYVSREYADTVHLHSPSSYMSYLDNGVTNGYAWYEANGTRQDYMNYWHHCREITIELSDTKLLPESELDALWNYNWRSLINYMKEARYGIHGIITDQTTGLPVKAKVFINGHDIDSSEVYSSANLGDYHRLLKAGTYTLEISASCYNTLTIPNVSVSDHSTLNLDIQLVPGAGVITTAATSITMTTASSGGTVICDGGTAITARGVCWSTSAYPTLANSYTINGAGSGTFTSSITGLSPATTYHVRAYVTNSGGTVYGNDITFSTTCGTISSFPWNEGFENAGVIPNCWSQEYVSTPNLSWTFITGSGNSNPAIAHGGTYNACLKDATSTADVTRLVSPPINLSGASSPTLTFWYTMAVWGTDQDLLTVKYRTSSTGSWISLISYTVSTTAWTQRTISLPAGSSNYYVAFEGSAKYGYGVCIDDVSITVSPPGLAVVTTTAASSISYTTATAGGNVTSEGGSAVTARGVCWSTSASPAIAGNHTTDGSGTGVFTSSLTGLLPNTLYHIRAYATNTSGTSYGDDLTFSTLNGLPVVSTTTPGSITNSSASSGGTVTSQGGSGVTARGVCWSTTTDPVVSGNHTTDGSGTGTFTSSITGLSSGILYHVRAYATNSYGTSYGSDLTFTTSCGTTVLPLAENFNLSTLPNCWSTQVTGTGAVNKWTVSNSVTAGGNPYEMKSTYQNINPATNRLVSIPFNTVGMGLLNLSFRHMLDAYGTGCTLRVQSSTDGINWSNEAWSVATTATNIAATMVSTFVSNNLNSPNTMIAFTVEGNLYQYDYWYIDNITINAAVTTPIVFTSSISSITTTTASGGGEVTSMGGDMVTARGICWATTSEPTILNSHTTDGSGIGTFTSSITGLSPATTYHLRAYATNSAGTSYGSDIQFTTCASMAAASVSIAASSNPVCANTPVTFTATPVNGGTPTYQWYKNSDAAGTGSSYSYVPLTGDQVYVVMTSNLGCTIGSPATSNTIIETVNPYLPVSISVSASLNPVLAGTSVTFTATPENGGAEPVFQWKVNEAIVGSNSPEYVYIPLDGDVIKCFLTSNATCMSGNQAQSEPITMAVTPLSLSVTPANQDVTFSSGVVVYSVSSNTNWTAVSDQSWCSITLSGSGNGSISATFDENISGSSRTAQITVSVSSLAPVVVTLTQEAPSVSKTLNLTLYLEGLFNGTGMNKAQNSSGDQFGGVVADQIVVELHTSLSPYPMVGAPQTVNIQMDGSASITFPPGLNSNYYVVVKHRNSLETWSATPLSFSGPVVTYDFSTDANKSFGNNLKLISGKYVICVGDINQDGVIDAGDMIPLDNDAKDNLSGYLETDINGDGLINMDDMNILNVNSASLITKKAP